MPERNGYPAGTPCWVDLATTDVDAAKAFYGPLFGWELEDLPTDAGPAYTQASMRQQLVAGMAPLDPDSAAQGIPPHWNTYVCVDDADAVTARVEPAGGTVVMAPMDVMDVGRMSVLADPTGGVIGTWQPKSHRGAQLVNEPGALCWNELVTTDVARAGEFYRAVFGWEPKTEDTGPMEYTTFYSGGEGIAGAMAPPMEGIPTFWGVYFAVADCDQTVAAARSAGAQVLAEPFDIPPGRMATLQDGQGAVVSVIALSEQSG